MKNPLKTYRKEIDNIDNQISGLLLKRLKIVKKIGKFKKKNKIKVINKKREKEIFRRLEKNHKKDSVYMKRIFNSIINNSRKVQR